MLRNARLHRHLDPSSHYEYKRAWSPRGSAIRVTNSALPPHARILSIFRTEPRVLRTTCNVKGTAVGPAGPAPSTTFSKCIGCQWRATAVLANQNIAF
ncbi:hypothetical protein V8C34DRAFT_267966 [Trichoderma compactum]